MIDQLRALVRRSNLIALPFAQAYAEGNMLGLVRITRGNEPLFDRLTGQLVPQNKTPVWEGIGRAYSITGPVTMALGEEPAYFSSTFISIPRSANQPEVDDVATWLQHPDISLLNREFRVTDVEAGGQLPTVWRMQVQGLQPGRSWRG